MQNSQLISIFRSLSPKEVRSLRKWLVSPAHNQREDVVRLFDYLIHTEHLNNEKTLTKEKLFAKVFPKQKFDDALLRQVMHFLLKTVEEFLAFQDWSEDPVRLRLALAGVYRKRKLDKVFLKTIKSIETLQQSHPYRDEHYLRNEYLLLQEQYVYLEGKKRIVPMNLQEISDKLDLTYCADKLRQSCLMLSHQKVYKAQYNAGLLQEVLQYVVEQNLLELPAIAIYYYVYQALTAKESEGFFYKLKETIVSHWALFPKEEMRDMYLMAINYCIGRMNAGYEAFVREAFDLYRQGFQRKLLIENNLISKFTFLNVIRIGLKLKEFSWVSDFINSHQQFIEESYRNSIIRFSLARLDFEKGDYDSAMKILVQADFDDVLVYLSAKAMLVRMYYEQNEYDALESLLESMRTYLKRKDMISGQQRVAYTNLVRFTKKMININPYNNKEPLQKLKEEVAKVNVAEKDWVLQQLEEL